MIRVSSENLESDSVRVTLEWTTYENHSQSLYSYNVSVSPMGALTSSERRVQLIASYDTSYDVSVVVLSQCGQRIVTTTIELYYGKTVTFSSTTNIHTCIALSFLSLIFSFNELSKSSTTG